MYCPLSVEERKGVNSAYVQTHTHSNNVWFGCGLPGMGNSLDQLWSMVAPLGVKKLDLTGLENTLCGCWVVICGRCGSFVGSACYLWVRGWCLWLELLVVGFFVYGWCHCLYVGGHCLFVGGWWLWVLVIIHVWALLLHHWCCSWHVRVVVGGLFMGGACHMWVASLFGGGCGWVVMVMGSDCCWSVGGAAVSPWCLLCSGWVHLWAACVGCR